jgi:hypothetical protein
MIDIYMTCYLVEECGKKERKPMLLTLDTVRRGVADDYGTHARIHVHVCTIRNHSIAIRVMCRP